MKQPFRTTVLALAILAVPFPASLPAQTPTPAPASASATQPSLSGTWKLNTAKSEYSPAPLPSNQTETLHLTPETVIIDFDSVAEDGKQKYTYTLKLNGPETPFPTTGVVNETALAILSSKATWKDNTLVLDQKVTYQGGPGTIRSTYSLSHDGKILTKTMSVSLDVGEFELKAIFDRA